MENGEKSFGSVMIAKKTPTQKKLIDAVPLKDVRWK